jgi:hypothetical protein
MVKRPLPSGRTAPACAFIAYPSPLWDSSFALVGAINMLSRHHRAAARRAVSAAALIDRRVFRGRHRKQGS